MENRRRSAEESALLAGDIIDELGLARAVLVSDSYHMLRSNLLTGRGEWVVCSSLAPASRIDYPRFYPSSLPREFAACDWFLIKQACNLPSTNVPGL